MLRVSTRREVSPATRPERGGHEELVRVAQSTLAVREKHANLSRGLVLAGMRPPVEEARARVELALAKLDVTAAERQLLRGRAEGDILRFDTRWLTWTYRIVLGALVAAIVYVVVFDISEYATGKAFVRVEGRRAVVAAYSGTVETVLVQPGQHVENGQVLVTMTAQLERAELRRATEEFNLHLAALLRDPGDHGAKQSLASLRPKRDQARQLARARSRASSARCSSSSSSVSTSNASRTSSRRRRSRRGRTSASPHACEGPSTSIT